MVNSTNLVFNMLLMHSHPFRAHEDCIGAPAAEEATPNCQWLQGKYQACLVVAVRVNPRVSISSRPTKRLKPPMFDSALLFCFFSNRLILFRAMITCSASSTTAYSSNTASAERSCHRAFHAHTNMQLSVPWM
ncbi:hypothetical protein SEMRO_953_G224191.1 [Seminavis robusta]|uniref:Uncharacterized protein n=1 Tax=Seminavis robusta TaxID=568900 RepID=A0A9N8ED92_9STRA|nr:hypothetical protein SEMRO_953_G224191.1 [Seminavis robusta]|eukprot:Sro953_g224191.1  (133) ;mRNA; f:14805-15203